MHLAMQESDCSMRPEGRIGFFSLAQVCSWHRPTFRRYRGGRVRKLGGQQTSLEETTDPPAAAEPPPSDLGRVGKLMALGLHDLEDRLMSYARWRRACRANYHGAYEAFR